MEKRGVIVSTEKWRELRDVRNQIAHEYLIEQSDEVLRLATKRGAELLETAAALKEYAHTKGYF